VKKLVLFPILSALFISTASADFKNDLANVYAEGVNSILFFTSEDIISSGYYTFDDSDTTLNTHFLPFTYQFKSDSDFYNFYANGSVGFSKYKEEHIDFGRGVEDTEKMTTYAVKVGGGVRLNILPDTDMMMGAAYIYSKVNGDYKTSQSLDRNNPDDKAIDDILNSNRTHHTYELSTSIGYHPMINAYQPYFRAGIRHFKTNVDSEYATISDTTSLITKLKTGVITPELTKIYDLPLKLEIYASEIFLAGDMDDVLGCDNFFVLGATFHLASPVEKEWIKEVTLDINMVRGDKFDGFNFGFGLSF